MVENGGEELPAIQSLSGLSARSRLAHNCSSWCVIVEEVTSETAGLYDDDDDDGAALLSLTGANSCVRKRESVAKLLVFEILYLYIFRALYFVVLSHCESIILFNYLTNASLLTTLILKCAIWPNCVVNSI